VLLRWKRSEKARIEKESSYNGSFFFLFETYLNGTEKMRKTYWVDRRINRFLSNSNDNTRQNGLNRYRKKPFAFPLHQQSRGK